MSAVPAWKRLGLKLKGPSDGSPVSAPPHSTAAPSSAPPAAGRFGHVQGASSYGTPSFPKRKQFPAGSGSYPASDSKRPRRDDADFTPSRKAVSFSQDTKKAAPKKPKTKKPPKPQAPPQPFDFTPVLEYLRAWHNARDTWKFNKNHQTLLIKYLYKGDAIPASDIGAFYSYVQDIKGASRKRLVEAAEDIRKKDMDAGAKGFPDGTKAPEEKQKQYEEIVADLLKKKAEDKEGATPHGTGKRSFDEVEFVLRTVDKDIQQRVVKRMRAETIIDELESSDSGESTATSASASTNVASSRVMVPVVHGDAKATNGNEGAKLKAKRRKKLRTADVDSSSESESSESESESDSDSDSSAAVEVKGGNDSSSSSSESDDDEDMDNANGVEDVGSSSSSSSSSEDGSASDSEDSDAGAVVTKDDDSGSDGDSESSDSDDEDA